MTSEASEIVRVTAPAFTAQYNWSVGQPMEKFILALKDKKLIAAKCPSCGYVYAPPRNRCGKCAAEIADGDMIELAGRGQLTGWTVAGVELDAAGEFQDRDQPLTIGAVKLEGADSTLFLPLEGVDPDKLKAGLAVKVLWNDETKGAISDIKGLGPD